MILDTSALIAILFREPEAEHFARAILDAEDCLLGAPTFVELSIVIQRLIGVEGSQQLDAFIRRAKIVIEPFTIEQALIARQAFLDFGKGRHPAGLNFGDCFSYALAKASGEPLLFKGGGFAQTDIESAL